MASISFPPLVPPSVTPLPGVEPVAAAVPAAVIAAEADALPFPMPAAPSPAPAAPADPGQAGAAMRPDQLFMSRQMNFPLADGDQLATSWRTMVRAYSAQLLRRDQQARAGQLPAAVLIATQDGRVQRQIDANGTIYPDAWRFTVHAHGAKEQHLSVVTADPDQEESSGRRKRGRAALRLELTMADGTRVVIQADPLPGGVVLELCAPGAAALERLRSLQPALALSVGRAGVRVLRWKYRDSLPPGQLHARLPSADAASVLSLPVFRAMAELALLLPAQQPLDEA